MGKPLVCANCGKLTCNGKCNEADLKKKERLVEHRPKDPSNN